MDTQQQLAAILGTNDMMFETLISQLMKPSNKERSHAESLFNLCLQTDPDTVFKKMLDRIQYSHQLQTRVMSAVLIMKHLTLDELVLWNSLRKTTRSLVKDRLLDRLPMEPSKSVSKNLSQTISELAAKELLVDNNWPQLLPFMFHSLGLCDFMLVESVLLIFARLAQFGGESFIAHRRKFHGLLGRCLGLSSADVRIAVVSALISFIPCLRSDSDKDEFLVFLPQMMCCSTEALNGGNEATTQEALKLFIGWAGTDPKFLLRQFEVVVPSMLQIAEAEFLEEDTRHLAIEFVIKLAESLRKLKSKKMRRFTQLISRLFAILMTMLLDIEDEEDELSDDDDDESSNYSVGQECLHRLAIALGGKTIVPIAFELLPPYLAAAPIEWQKRLAPLVALAQIAKGSSKEMMKDLERVVTIVLESSQDPHPRVKWAAIFAIRRFSTDLGPDFQAQFHARVFPALNSAMSDLNARVQAQAASAVVNFSENCTPGILTPYAAIRIKAFGAAISYIRRSFSVNFVLRVVEETSEVLIKEGLDEPQEAMIQGMLKLLTEWAHDSNQDSNLPYSDLSRECLVKLFKEVILIAESPSLVNETKNLAMNFLITLGESKIGHRLDWSYYSSVIRILMSMLLDIQNEVVSHWLQNEDYGAVESRNYGFVLEFLGRLAPCCSSKELDLLEIYVKASEWQHRVVAIAALAQIIKVKNKYYDDLVSMVLGLCVDSDQRVRLAAINAAGQLSTNLNPDIACRVLPALTSAIQDFQDLGVQECAVSAMVNMTKNFPVEIWKPFLAETLSTLLEHLRAENGHASEQAIKLLKQFRWTLPAVVGTEIWPTLNPDLQMAWLNSLMQQFQIVMD